MTVRSRFRPLLLIVLIISIRVTYAGSGNEFINQFNSYLLDSQGKKTDGSYLNDKDYIIVYYSASWCGPCHAFTPKLVEFYNNKKNRGNFEIVLLSLDNSQKKMIDYMKKSKMPWKAVEFSKINASGFLSTRFVRPTNSKGSFGIPYLVVLDKNGKIILEPYNEDKYIGANGVLANIKKMYE